MSGEVRACWCFLDGTEACDSCTFKVYYPDADKKVEFFEADEDDFYPV